MGLWQKAVETYDANLRMVGVYEENHEPLAPIGHTLTNANIEITLNGTGKCIQCRRVDESEPKILIPVTEESGGRTSKPVAHPLCDQLAYVAPKDEKKYNTYVESIRDWATSDFSHPFLDVILSYVEGGTILTDLAESGVTGKDKDMVCWRIVGFENEEPACWKNKTLFNKFIDYYDFQLSSRDVKLCMISGDNVAIALQHPKGIVSNYGNAKLISANDSNGFTYRGRFQEDWQAASLGYFASQKAHNALRWLISTQGVRESNRVFLCWTPSGKQLPNPMRRSIPNSDTTPRRVPSDYKQALQNTLLSYRTDWQFKGTEATVIAAFDAATNGRLALTYYNEISINQFLERMETWDLNCCWYWHRGSHEIQAPNLLEIVRCACGIQRENRLEVDDKNRSLLLQRLLNCKINGGVFPLDVVKALTQRASTPQAYEKNTWREIVYIACSVLQKYRYDTKQGDNEMAWKLDKLNRSFQYGRLLAVMERAEEDYYSKTEDMETRQSNAIKSMSEYRRRPWSVFERINQELHRAYLNRIEPWQARRYERLKGEIVALLSEFPEEELKKPLDDLYLMGYELQRNDFFTKKETNDNKTEA